MWPISFRRGAIRCVALTLALLCMAPLARAAGTLTLDRATYEVGDTVQATYTTDTPGDKNWLGVYRQPGNGPVNGVYVGPSSTWTYATGASGVRSLPTQELTPGRHVVYFLLNDGYQSITTPVEFDLVPRSNVLPLAFLSDRLSERNARAGESYSGSIRASARSSNGPVVYSKVSGPAWLSVAANGDLSGSASAGDIGANTFSVQAVDAGGATVQSTLDIRVRPADEPRADQVRILSFNAWDGGSHVELGREKQLRVLFAESADIVAIQENAGNTAQALADALGWYHFSSGSNLAILSRYPIVSTHAVALGGSDAALGARIRIADFPTQEIIAWTTQLGFSPYPPHDACFGQLSASQLVQREHDSGRVAAANAILTGLSSQLQDPQADVVLAADLHSPSHRDWTEATTAAHCTVGPVMWPTTLAIESAGLADTYRRIHPDPAIAAGNTWSPVYPLQGGTSGPVEPQDRINYIFHRAANWATVASEAIVHGTPSAYPDVARNLWPSDHAAVLTTLEYRDPGDRVFTDGFE
ncbi:endonuclease/exonuclease/phosphatase family protein [Tahibacter amnicola]|uniref:Endonuclease/exonuclease/phosphatase family protein n=1 Tax=Tahibacter amnicola TaxID=2976241 RepID=A0ABY6BIL8_9GAMM|nr:endonuclease/exonuclease/phosphatase family protein [Tahibacter amnicola]UXI69858.1 endonuclease/exonuclease/phosphatase family protein [Tahibacter amnicola]